jgi:hypothetical protein
MAALLLLTCDLLHCRCPLLLHFRRRFGVWWQADLVPDKVPLGTVEGGVLCGPAEFTGKPGALRASAACPATAAAASAASAAASAASLLVTRKFLDPGFDARKFCTSRQRLRILLLWLLYCWLLLRCLLLLCCRLLRLTCCCRHCLLLPSPLPLDEPGPFCAWGGRLLLLSAALLPA